jgi:CRISPR-associated endonuclease/helicase Cas3
MAAESESFFINNFLRLTKQQPYPWQKKLFLQFSASPRGLWPEVVDLPTGAGKTSVLHVWLLALAWSIRAETYGVPRRLAWIVNRRVVVDQVTSEVEALLREIAAPESEVGRLLASVSQTDTPLAASTLRGQLADNRDWGRDPSTPAVVVGTVDMIGSRLLFRGYRAGHYYRPIHAGLLGVDTLIVNDEAHLSPALARLLTAVRDQAPAAQIAGKSFRILLLSATPGSAEGLQRFEHDLAEDAVEGSPFSAIFHAPKSLFLRETANANEIDAAVWKLATDSPAPRTAIFIEQPEKALKLAQRLDKEKHPCALLTGTMRGFERDRLLKDKTFELFLRPEPGAEPVWLVCTSAGEVGINFTSERMITGLAEGDHLLQRFGRLNRFGDSTVGEAYMVFKNPSDNESEKRLRETLAYLRRLGGDISCANIWEHRPPSDACAERPAMASLEDRHIDLWAQTTYPDRFVPPVASWLHGKQESEAPDTEVVWRSDVKILTDWDVDPEQIRRVLEYYPIRAREKLSEPASRVGKKLAAIQEHLDGAEALKKKIIVVESDGTPTVRDLAYLVKQVEKDQRDQSYLGYKMLLLPDDLGSAPAGMFHSAARDEATETLDVADPVSESEHDYERTRFVFREGGVERLKTTEKAGAPTPPPLSTSRPDLEEFASGKYKPALVIRHPEKEDTALVYFEARSKRKFKPENVGLSDHQEAVASTAKELASKLHLGGLEKTYETAGRIHDSGKHRPVWQSAMGGSMEKPLAKTKQPVNLRLINGYRHELGSLLDALSGCDGPVDDLLFHLIASHHAAARPFFETQQYDRQNISTCAEECVEVARRYARLQKQYGPWGLAYLEAVFKCADGIVSASEGEPASD